VTLPVAPDADGGPPRVVLVETSDALPGLLPFQAWDVLGTAGTVWLRDVEDHPSAPHLYYAGLDLRAVEPAPLERADLDLSRPGDPVSRRLAKALLQVAVAEGVAVYLLGSDDGGIAPALAGMAPDHGAEIELVFLAQQPAGTELLRLVDVMRQLRDPDTGCPWDLEQDHATLRRYLVEEAYELLHAIEEEDDAELQEELGDVLLQVVFHAQVARDRGAFTIDDVARGIADKLVRRHPHVFADGEASTAAEVQDNWDRLKTAEKARTSPFDGVPPAGPGLHLLETLQRKAAKRGFDWSDPSGPADRVRRELDELVGAADPAAQREELGDLLGAVVALGRHLDVDPEEAARAAGARFRRRFEAVLELARGRELDPDDLDTEAWLALWDEAKRREGRGRPPAPGPVEDGGDGSAAEDGNAGAR
jgi:MazG family protein